MQNLHILFQYLHVLSPSTSSASLRSFSFSADVISFFFTHFDFLLCAFARFHATWVSSFYTFTINFDLINLLFVSFLTFVIADCLGLITLACVSFCLYWFSSMRALLACYVVRVASSAIFSLCFMEERRADLREVTWSLTTSVSFVSLSSFFLCSFFVLLRKESVTDLSAWIVLAQSCSVLLALDSATWIDKAVESRNCSISDSRLIIT